MVKYLFYMLSAFVAMFFIHDADAQNKHDSLAFVSAGWDWQPAGKRAEAASVSLEIFGSRQTISAVRYQTRKLKTMILHAPGEDAATADSLAMAIGATVAINGSYFNIRTLYPHTFLSVAHKTVGVSSKEEAIRSNGILAFKYKNGKHMEIFPCDTNCYEQYRTKFHSAIAAGPLLLQDGQACSFRDNSFNTTRHPRSIIGYDKNGYCYFIVIDGRFPRQGEGATIAEAAAIARYFGLEDAINMDGGGSSTLWTESTGVINHPSDNKRFDHAGCRTVPNIIYAL